jgi:hypothetical protein
MRATERVMLYAVALVVGGMLVLDRGATEATSATTAPREQVLLAQRSNIDRPHLNADNPAPKRPVPKTVAPETVVPETVAPETVAPETVAPETMAPVTVAPEKSPGAISPRHSSMEPIVLQDAAGHPRIELLVNDDGQAQLVLRSSSGEPGVILAVDADGDSVAKIIRGDHMGKIIASREGDISLTLTSRQSGFEAAVSSDGGSHLQLTGLENAQAAILVAPNGDAEMRITGSKLAAEALMRVLNDGLGQITVRGKDSDDGPNMMRLADGVAIMATQLPDGKPGGSMVTSPNGTSMIAVKSLDGKNSASLRMSSDGKAEISATEPGK